MRPGSARELAFRALVVGSSAVAGCGAGGSAGAGGPDASPSSSGPTDDICGRALELIQERVVPDPLTSERGSWGAIPSVLRQLPPDGVLCGSVVGDAGSAGTVILTHLTGRAVFDFYAPLMTAAGCHSEGGANAGPIFYFVCSDATPASVDATDPAHAYIVIS